MHLAQALIRIQSLHPHIMEALSLSDDHVTKLRAMLKRVHSVQQGGSKQHGRMSHTMTAQLQQCMPHNASTFCISVQYKISIPVHVCADILTM